MKKIFLVQLILLFVNISLYSEDISITVYNDNFALIREVRGLKINSGKTTISYSEVAALIKPASVHFKSLTSPEKLNILEQNFEYDLVNSAKIMQKYIDHPIHLITKNGDLFSGQLLSAGNSDIILKLDSGEINIIRSENVQYYNFPELPEGLITRPTLVWLVENSGPENQKTEISYLTGGMMWQAEYVGVIEKDSKSMEFSGWVSLKNHTGTTYRNAKLKLVAGDVHTVDKVKHYPLSESVRIKSLAARPQFEEKSFFEYHLYTLKRRTTLKNNQTKQLSLFPQTKTKVNKIYVYDGSRYNTKIRVNLEFMNNKKYELGMPLPKGKIRVYKKDEDGSQEFVGEDLIDHTPVNEKVRVYLGNAFDIVGERSKISEKKISSRVREEKYKIKLRNHKKNSVEIVVIEHFRGDWDIIEYSHSFDKRDAYTAESIVNVPADEEVEITYSVILKW